MAAILPGPVSAAGEIPLELGFLDVSGREIAVRDAESFPVAGPWAVRWNPGREAPGVYFVRLELGSRASATARCVVLE